MASKSFTSKEAQWQIDAILDLIEQRGTVEIAEVMAALNIKHSTACGYLRHIANDLNMIREAPKPIGTFWGAPLKRYEMGADPALVALSIDAPIRPRSPAVQVGMWRDGLVAALFGDVPGVVV